jgi:K(+)-stimulated pyrophosphate-energized sodium pump
MDYLNWLYVGIAGGVISIAVAIYLYFWVMRQDPGSERAQKVASWIRSGANTYLKRLYTALASLALILGIVIALIFSFNFENLATTGIVIEPGSGAIMAACFVVGALCSAIAGYMGMRVAVEANVRTATAAQKSLQQAFRLSFYAGSVLAWQWSVWL